MVLRLGISTLVVLALLGGVRQGLAQTVIRDSAPPARSDTGVKAAPDTAARPPGDTGARAARPDTAPKPAAAPAPPPAFDPHPKGVCADDVASSGGEAPDLLLVTFLAHSDSSEREAAIKAIEGKVVAADPGDPATWYIRVPSGGNEFALRNIADRLIRARPVKEVGPVQCPARP